MRAWRFTCIRAARWRTHIQVDEMPNLIVCFALGVVAPLASVGWLIAYH